jgi:uncharacterized coiled-coil DUF342 family protein
MNKQLAELLLSTTVDLVESRMEDLKRQIKKLTEERDELRQQVRLLAAALTKGDKS